MTLSIKNLGVSIAVAVAAVVLMVAATNLLAQDNAYTGVQYEYREIVFNEPITFDTNISAGYLLNGQQVVPNNPEAAARQVFRSLGNNGWELASSTDNRIFIFTRPKQ